MTRNPAQLLAAALLALALGAAAQPASAPALERLRKMVALAEEARGELDSPDATRTLAANEALARRHRRALADLGRGRGPLAGPPDEVRQAEVEQALHFADRARAELEDLVDLVAEEIRQAAERRRQERIRQQREEEARRERIESQLRDSEERARELLSQASPPPPAPPPPAPPPAELRAAVEAYFERDYPRALEILAGDELRGRAAAHAHLLRAASRFALHALGGEQQEDLLAAARSDVRSCRQVAPDLVPDPRFFSPRFRKFFGDG